MNIVRTNLMNEPNYTPYCGKDSKCGGMWPRTQFNGKQFVCNACGWESQFDDEFIKEYKSKWNKDNP